MDKIYDICCGIDVHKKLIVACGSGALELQQVQLEGGKRISGEDFMRGRKAQQLGE